MLHEGNKSHGNLSVSHIGCSLGVCKLRMSLTLPQPSSPDFLKDIHSIGVIGYQMAYGIPGNNSPCDDPCEDTPNNRRRMVDELRSKAVEAA